MKLWKIEKELQKRCSIAKQFLSRNELSLLENGINRFIDSIIFNSNDNAWKTSNSYFHLRLKNKSDLVILIETTEGKKFGCYLKTDIYDLDNYINDENAFLFSYTNDSLFQYPMKHPEYAFNLCSKEQENLFVIGKSDVVIKKEEMKQKCKCRQSSFKYFGIENALIGRKGTFEVKQFAVFSTIGKDEKKKESKSYQKLEEWTGLKCGDILFDSDVDNWNINESLLNERIIGKKQIAFIIEDSDNELFGYYLNSTVEEKYTILSTDKKSFHFNLESFGRLKYPTQFPIQNIKLGGLKLFEKSHDSLITIGDISLFKVHKKNWSSISQLDTNFDYHRLSLALCGKQVFTPIKIIVIQMI